MKNFYDIKNLPAPGTKCIVKIVARGYGEAMFKKKIAERKKGGANNDKHIL